MHAIAFLVRSAGVASHQERSAEDSGDERDATLFTPMAKPPVTTTVHHLIDKRFVGINDQGLRVSIDGEPQARTGMGPMDLVLNAVGACAAYDLVEMLKKRKLEILEYRVELTGERFDGTPAYYTNVHAVHHFNVPGLDERTANRFVGLAMTKYCSVASSLKAEMTYDVVLHHDAPPSSDDD